MKFAGRTHFTGLCILGSLVVGTGSAGVLASPYSAEVQSLNPLAYYQFNDTISDGNTATDSATPAHNGTYNIGAGSISAGSGIPLPGFGANQSVVVANGGLVSASDSFLPSGNSARTVTSWIKTINDGSNYRDVFSYGTIGNGNMVFTLVPSASANPDFIPNRFGTSFYGGGADVTTSSSAPVINNGGWHMIAFTLTPTTPGNDDVELYVDGNLEASAIRPINTTLGGGLKMGTDLLNLNYNGQFAQVAVFNTALDSTDISNLYAAAQTPEPTTATLGGIGLGLLLAARRRRSA